MTDRNNKILLAVVLAICVIAVPFGVRYIANKVKTERTEIATTTQAVVTSQASVDRVKSQYVATKDKNIQKEKQAAKKAVIEADEELNTDAEIGIAWGQLVQEAKEYNDKVRGDM